MDKNSLLIGIPPSDLRQSIDVLMIFIIIFCAWLKRIIFSEIHFKAYPKDPFPKKSISSNL
jgi:hypothetical protein